MAEPNKYSNNLCNHSITHNNTNSHTSLNRMSHRNQLLNPHPRKTYRNHKCIAVRHYRLVGYHQVGVWHNGNTTVNNT